MVHEVYVDVLIVTNFLINYALLSLLSRLCGRNRIKLRLILSSLIGALFSLTIFLPELGGWYELGIKIISSVLMVLIANKFISMVEILKEWLLLFIITALFGGLMMNIYTTVIPNFMLYANGVVYFHLSPILLIINISIAYAIICLADMLLHLSVLKEGKYIVTLRLFGKEKRLHALVDTGNSLTEPFSNIPVVVCGLEDINELLPNELSMAMRIFFINNSSEHFPPEYQAKIRMIPFHGVGASGILPALKGDSLKIEMDGRENLIESFYIAISQERIYSNGCRMLLGKDMLCVI